MAFRIITGLFEQTAPIGTYYWGKGFNDGKVYALFLAPNPGFQRPTFYLCDELVPPP